MWKLGPLSNQAENGTKLSCLKNVLSRLCDIVIFRHNSSFHGIRDDSSQQNAILIRSKYHSWRWHKVHGAECSVELTAAQSASKFPVAYATRTIVFFFCKSYYWSLSWTRWSTSHLHIAVYCSSTVIQLSHVSPGLQSCQFTFKVTTKVIHR